MPQSALLLLEEGKAWWGYLGSLIIFLARILNDRQPACRLQTSIHMSIAIYTLQCLDYVRCSEVHKSCSSIHAPTEDMCATETHGNVYPIYIPNRSYALETASLGPASKTAPLSLTRSGSITDSRSSTLAALVTFRRRIEAAAGGKCAFLTRRISMIS